MATTQASDPNHSASCGSGTQDSRSVWYKFTPTTNGTISATTFASDYDTLLTVYAGTTCGATPAGWTEIQCNDDNDQETQSHLTFAVTAYALYLPIFRLGSVV